MNSHIMRAAKELIERSETWCKGARARNSEGTEVPVMSDSAFSFCSKGALLRVSGGEDADITECERFLEMTARVNYVGFNELHDHDDVLEMWAAAIAKAELFERRSVHSPTVVV